MHIYNVILLTLGADLLFFLLLKIRDLNSDSF
jgi:hypothetical protein